MHWALKAFLCLALVARAGALLSQPIPELAQAQALIRGGEPHSAWQLLAPLEARYAGRADYDLELAIAARESGQPARATFVLERVIALDPAHAAARLEMARAFFALGDFERAEREFRFVADSAPSPEAQRVLAAYRAKMGITQDVPGRLRGYVEAGFGRDTNVSGVAAHPDILVAPNGALLVFDPAVNRTADDFWRVAAGLSYARPVTDRVGLVAGVDVDYRRHSEADPFDSRWIELHGAIEHRLDARDSLEYGLRHRRLDLDHAGFRTVQTATLKGTRVLGPHARVSLSGQGYRIRYVDEALRPNDSDLLAATASAVLALDAAGSTVGAAALSFGSDSAVADRPDGDRRLQGVSLGLQRRLPHGVEAFANASLLASRYAQPNPDFGAQRRDRQRDLTAGLLWQPAPGWWLRPQVTRTVQRSNLPLHAYSRTETSIALRRTWD